MLFEEFDNTPLTQAEVFHFAAQSSVGRVPSIDTTDALRQKPKYALRTILHSYAVERNKIGYVDPVNHDFIYTSAVLERYPHLCEPHIHQRHCPHVVMTKKARHHRSPQDTFGEKGAVFSQSLDNATNQKVETKREEGNSNLITSSRNDSNTLLSLVPSAAASDRSGQLLVETMAYRRRQGDLRRGGRSGRDRSGRAARSSQTKREKNHGGEEGEALEEKLAARTRDFRCGACEWNKDINYESSGCSSTSSASSESSFSFSSFSSSNSSGQERKNTTEIKTVLAGGGGWPGPLRKSNSRNSLLGANRRSSFSSSSSASSFSSSISSSSSSNRRRISISSSGGSLSTDDEHNGPSSSCKEKTAKTEEEGKDIFKKRRRKSVKKGSDGNNNNMTFPSANAGLLLIGGGTRRVMVESALAETEIPIIFSQGRKVLGKRDAPLDHIYLPPKTKGREARRREYKLLRLVNPALRPHSEPFLPQKSMPDIEDVRRLPRYAQSRRVHLAAMAAGADCYRDLYTGCVVFCKSFLSQVPCCGQQCRHCPYGHHALAFSPEQAASIIAKEVATKKTYSCKSEKPINAGVKSQCENGLPSILIGGDHSVSVDNPQLQTNEAKTPTSTSPTTSSPATAAAAAFTPATIIAHWVKEGFGGFRIASSSSQPSGALSLRTTALYEELSSLAQQSGPHVHACTPLQTTPSPLFSSTPSARFVSVTPAAAPFAKTSAPSASMPAVSPQLTMYEDRQQTIPLILNSKEMIGSNESQQHQQVVSVNDLKLLLMRPTNNNERSTGGIHARVLKGGRGRVKQPAESSDRTKSTAMPESDDEEEDDDSGESDLVGENEEEEEIEEYYEDEEDDEAEEEEA